MNTHLNVPTRSNRYNNLAHQEKFEEQETWHKLVVKIINWKDGLLRDKITSKEWRVYCEHMVKTNISQGGDKVLHTLKETKEIITSFGGFK